MSNKKNKIYVVARGHETGIYEDNLEATKQITGFSGGKMIAFNKQDILIAKSYLRAARKSTGKKLNIYFYVVLNCKTPQIVCNADEVDNIKRHEPKIVVKKTKDQQKAKKELLKHQKTESAESKEFVESKKEKIKKPNRTYVVFNGKKFLKFKREELDSAIKLGKKTKNKVLKFTNEQKANEYIAQNETNNDTDTLTANKKANDNDMLQIYVDGSYNGEFCSYACVVLDKNGPQFLSGCVKDEEHLCNVAGELTAAKTAIQYCLDNKIKRVSIYYDFSGIEEYCLNGKNMKKNFVNKYCDFVNKAKEKTDINFVKVKAHSKDKFNDMADMLAKNAITLATLK